MNATNPFIPNGLFSLDRSIPYKKGAWLVFIISCFVEISVLNGNSVDPDQTPRSAASDLDLHCLPMSLLWDARLKWEVKPKSTYLILIVSRSFILINPVQLFVCLYHVDISTAYVHFVCTSATQSYQHSFLTSHSHVTLWF